MPKVLFKETVTKKGEINIPPKTLFAILNSLPATEKKKLAKNLLDSIEKGGEIKFTRFKKDTLPNIIADFRNADLYEEDLLKDLEEGLRKSSVYKQSCPK